VTTQLDHINECVDFASPRCGALLNWQNPGNPFWHYGMGLLGLLVFDTGRGLTVFEKMEMLAFCEYRPSASAYKTD
jgi:hypothetical protein